MKKSGMMKIKKLGLCMLASLFVFAAVCGFGTTAYAAQVEITPIEATVYCVEGATVQLSLDANASRIPLPENAPIAITGATNVGYFRACINDIECYIHAKDISLTPIAADLVQGEIRAAAALVGDAKTGELIYSQDVLARRAPASTTKIMTALLVLEAIEEGKITMNTPVTVSASAIAGMPSDASHVTPRLKKGEIMTVQSLLQCVMIRSDCHACNVLAEAVSGSVSEFVARMNQRAAELGCVDTNFVNPSGYPDDQHYSNAYSLFLITREAVKRPDFLSIVGLREVTIPATNLVAARQVKATNELLLPDSAYYNPYAFGIKTGSAKSSGLCMVAGATQNGNMVISVVLGAKKENQNGSVVNHQFFESNRLLGYGLKKCGGQD